MSPPRLPTVLRAVATAALWLMCSLPLLAAGDAELIAAAQAVAQNGAAADPAMRALIIARNKDFQRLSLNSRNISANVFEKCQAWYVETMTQYAREEGAKLGIVVHTQASVAKPAKPGQKYVEFQPGTDLDLITDATTPEQIADTRLWLASDEGGAANGAIVPLYGGL